MGTSNPLLAKLPPWVLSLAIVAVVVVIGLLYISKTPFRCSNSSEGFSCGFVSEPGVVHENYVGYYYDWDERGATYCAHEDLDLGFADDEVSITAKSIGKVKDRYGELVDASWSLRGYKLGTNLALAYISAQLPRTGNGVYYLIQNRGEYAGYWIGFDSPSGKVIRCPYLLTKSKKAETESCESRWPQVFSAANQCREVVFP